MTDMWLALLMLDWFPLLWFAVLIAAFFLGWQANNLRGWIRERRALRKSQSAYPDAMALTTDPSDPRLSNEDENGLQEAYLVLSDEERAKGFVRPFRKTYVHNACGTATTMATAIAETYAVNPSYYGATYCVGCRGHFPVGEFVWDGSSEVVGS